MTLTVLGSAGTFPRAGEACSGYLVRSAGATTIVDLGPGTLANLQHHITPDAIDAIVLSHSHPDHWLDLPVLRNAMRYVFDVSDVPVYGTRETLAMAESLIDGLAPTLLWTVIDGAAHVEVGDQRIRFAPTDHPVETLSMRIDADGRSLAYSADTGPEWSPVALGAGIDLFLCEATLSSEAEGAVQHLSGRQAGERAAAGDVDRLVLTHVQPWSEAKERLAGARSTFAGPIELACAHTTFDV